MGLLASSSLMAQVDLKVKTTDGDYNLKEATAITFSDNLSVQTIHTQDGTDLDMAMQHIREVILRDTMQNVANYILADPDCKIYQWIFNYGKDMQASYNNAYPYFYANFADPVQTAEDQTGYTPELQSRFALFVPVDSALDTVPYYLSFATRMPQAIKLQYTSGNFPFKLTRCVHRYNPETVEVGDITPAQRLDQSTVITFLRDLFLQHTVFFDRPEDRELGIRSGNEYFLTMAGTVVRIAPDGKSVQGAMQMDHEARGITRFSACHVIDSHRKENGTVYKLDSPILPPSVLQTPYTVLSGEGYEEFFKLCQADRDLLIKLFQIDINRPQDRASLDRYSTFIDKNGGTPGLAFLPTHPFTLYAPSNEAVLQAIANGLPTWESLTETYGSADDTDEALLAEGRSKVYELLNFVRYHFHFGTEIADRLPFETRTHNTPVVLPDRGYATPSLRVRSAGNGTLTVTDATGQSYQVLDEGKNIFVRDVECSNKVAGATTMNGSYALYYSPGVIHRINGVLRYK